MGIEALASDLEKNSKVANAVVDSQQRLRHC